MYTMLRKAMPMLFLIVLVFNFQYIAGQAHPDEITLDNYQEILDQLDDMKEEYESYSHSSFKKIQGNPATHRILQSTNTTNTTNSTSNSTNSTSNTTTTTTTNTVTYNYSQGGSDWTDDLCTSGTMQSPINIPSTRGSCDNTMTFDWVVSNLTTALTATNNGAYLRYAGALGSLYATDVNGNLLGYNCTSFHIHAPAENQIQDTSYSLEVQWTCPILTTFTSPTGQTRAIVSVMFKVDDTSSANAFITALKAPTAGTYSLNLTALFYNQLAQPMTYYSFQGSITNPPCNETVNWYVLDHSLTLTTTQLASFTSIWARKATFAGGRGNNRNIQSFNSRTVKYGGDSCEEQFVYFFSFFILYVFINYFIFRLL